MKIGIYDPYLDTLAGGERYVLTTVSCFAKNNTVSIFWDKKEEEDIKKEVKRKFNLDLSRIEFVDNVFEKSIPFYKRLQESKKYDVIFLLSDGSFPLLLCPLILHFQSPVQWVNGAAFKNKIKLKRTKAIVCNSNFTKSFIDKKFGVNSIVIYPPVDVSHVSEMGEKENIILNVGRFGIKMQGSSYKKQEILVGVFKKMVKQGLAGWKFVLVVSVKDEHKEALEVLKESAKGFPIEFIVNPPNEVLISMYKKAKIYWHAAGFGEDIEKNPDRAEHFGIATVEAMSMSAIPIVFNAGGQKEIVDDGKNGFVWNIEKELEEKTEQVVNNTSLMKKLAEGAEKKAQTYNQERFCKEITSLIT